MTDVVIANRIEAYSILVKKDWTRTYKGHATAWAEQAAVKLARRWTCSPESTSEHERFVRVPPSKEGQVKLNYAGSTWTWASRALGIGGNSGKHKWPTLHVWFLPAGKKTFWYHRYVVLSKTPSWWVWLPYAAYVGIAPSSEFQQSFSWDYREDSTSERIIYLPRMSDSSHLFGERRRLQGCPLSRPRKEENPKRGKKIGENG